jgi:hypothetical protein
LRKLYNTVATALFNDLQEDPSNNTHHINDLLESYPKCEHKRLGLVEDGPVESVVVREKGAQQPLLLGSSS